MVALASGGEGGKKLKLKICKITIMGAAISHGMTTAGRHDSLSINLKSNFWGVYLDSFADYFNI